MNLIKVEDVLAEVQAEIDYQAGRWADGNPDTLVENDLKNNGPADFVAYIAHYSTKWFPGGFPPYSRETLANYRKCMVKTAALAVSAVRWVDAKLQQID